MNKLLVSISFVALAGCLTNTPDNNATINNATTNNASNNTNNGTNSADPNNANNANTNNANNASACETPCDPGVCDEDSGQCVTCDGSNAGCTAPQVCAVDPLDATQNVCVDCVDDTQCNDVTASACDDGTCRACFTDNDCAHLPDTPRCRSRTCFECVPETADIDCGGKVCDPETFACTTIDLASAEQCEPCMYDAQCMDNHKCILLDFPVGVPRGGYCLLARDEAPNGMCPRPYGVFVRGESVDGAGSAMYCGISESRTTCEAVRAHFNDINCDGGNGNPDVDLCMADGARCETLAVGGLRCTYSCLHPEQCAVGQTCGDTGGTGTDYCGG